MAHPSGETQGDTDVPRQAQFSLATIVRVMLREEYRLYLDLFGRTRFVFFPAFVTLLVGGVSLIAAVDPPTLTTVFAGICVVLFVVGVQTGSVGFTDSTILSELTGSTTFSVTAGDFLPVSDARLLTGFLIKDVLYYTGLFIIPLVIGTAPVVLALSTVTAVGLLFIGSIMSLTLGVATTVCVYAFSTRSQSVKVAGAIGFGGGLSLALWAVYQRELLLWDVLVNTNPVGIAAWLLLPVGLTSIARIAYLPTFSRTTPARPGRSLLDVRDLLPGKPSILIIKQLATLTRSPGGYGKVVFSQALVVVLSIGGSVAIGRQLPVTPDTGLFMPAVAGLAAHTSYTWLTQFETESDYTLYPVTRVDLYTALFRSFVLVSLPSMLVVFITVGYTVQPPESIYSGLLGLGLLTAIHVYLFGLLSLLAGTAPTRMLFNTARFSLFSFAVIVGLVPLVTISLTTASWRLSVGAMFGFCLAVVGLILHLVNTQRSFAQTVDD